MERSGILIKIFSLLAIFSIFTVGLVSTIYGGPYLTPVGITSGEPGSPVTFAPPYQYLFFDDYDTGVLNTANWTVSATSGIAGVGSHTSNSGSYSMYTSEGVVSITSKTIDTSVHQYILIGYWVRIGSDTFSEDPDDGENLIVEYYNSNNAWASLNTIYGTSTPGQIYTPVHNLSGLALHSNFQLRFRQTGGSSTGCDYFHIDDVYIKVPLWGDLEVIVDKLAPAEAPQNARNVHISKITVSAVDGGVIFYSLKLNLSGNGSDSDVASVNLVHDVDHSGDLSDGDTLLSTGKFQSKRITMPVARIVQYMSTAAFLVIFNISKTAVCGHTVGVSINSGDLNLGSQSSVTDFSTATNMQTMIIEKTDFLEVTGIDEAPLSAFQGQCGVHMMTASVRAIQGSVMLYDLLFGLTGTGTDSDLSCVKLYLDADADALCDDAKDIELGSKTCAGRQLGFDHLSLMINENEVKRFFIIYELSEKAVAGNTVGVELEMKHVNIKAPDVVLSTGPLWGGPLMVVVKNDTTPPGAPLDLSITDVTSDSIALEWDPSIDEDIIGYNLYRSQVQSPSSWGKPIASTPPGIEKYTDTGLEESTTYYYVVTAFDEGLYESDPSNAAFATTLLGPRKPVVNVPQQDFIILEDTVDDSTIDLLTWFKDENDDPLSFRCEGAMNIKVNIDQDTGGVELIPKKNWNGVETLKFIASDGSEETGDDVIITVSPVNDPPEYVAILNPRDGLEYEHPARLDLKATGTDPDLVYGDIIVFVWRSNISGLLGAGIILNDISLDDGVHTITLEVTDLAGVTVMDSISVKMKRSETTGTNDTTDDNDDGPDQDLDGQSNFIDDDFTDVDETDKFNMIPVYIGLIIIVILILVLQMIFMGYLKKKPEEAESPTPPEARTENET